MLRNHSSFKEIEMFFSAIRGIRDVKIEPIIQTMVIVYNEREVTKRKICQYISLFFRHESLDPLDPIIVNVTPGIRKAVFRSLVTGFLLLVAFVKKRYTSRIDVFDYLVVISTAHTVLTHGGTNRYRHPDILTGIISLFSLGASNLLHVCMVTWAVNVLEILHDIKRANKSPII
jgi:hypothetical protein